VGEDVYRAAIDAGAIREDARGALARAAREHGLDSSGAPARIAHAIFDAYLGGRFPERLVCEVMTWCYAGWTFEALGEFARTALTSARIESRLNRRLEPILQFARGVGIRTVVISASPAPVVWEAASLWGFDRDDIAAAIPAVDSGVIQDRMGGPLPYAETKTELGRRLLGDAQWLAAFGDNVFDIDMFAAACFGVAVDPKPALAQALPSLPNVVRLA
jgi:phosphoserine phosphatase